MAIFSRQSGVAWPASCCGRVHGVVKAQRTADNTQFMVAGQRPAITTDSHETVQAIWISFRSGVDATDPLAHTDRSC